MNPSYVITKQSEQEITVIDL
jgi:hypothetical protein